MRIPPYLRYGDEVAIVSPSFSVDPKKIEDAVKVLESWGLKVRLGEHVFGSEGPFAGTDKERLEDIQKMIGRPFSQGSAFRKRGLWGDKDH